MTGENQSTDSLSDLFGSEEPDDLSILFDSPAEADVSASAGGLEALFEETESPQTAESDSAGPEDSFDLAGIFSEDTSEEGLAGLFDDDAAPDPSESPETGTPNQEEPTEENSPDAIKKDTSEVAEGEVRVERKRTPPVLGQLARPTRTLELKGKPVVARSASRRAEENLKAAPKKEAAKAAKEKSDTEPEAPEEGTPTHAEIDVKTQEKTADGGERAEATDLAALGDEQEKGGLSAEAPQSGELDVSERDEEMEDSLEDVFSDAVLSTPAQEEIPAPSTEPFAASAENNLNLTPHVPAAAETMQQPQPSAAPPAVLPGEAFQQQRKLAESEHLTQEAERRLMLQAELDRQARRYEDAARLWGYVDRIVGVVGTEPSVQSVINHFQLTRDAHVDKRQYDELMSALRPLLSSRGLSTGSPADQAFVMEMLYDELLGISVLGPLWRDDKVTEILVDSWNSISVESAGVLLPTPLSFRDAEHASSVARSLAGRISDRAVSNSNPLVTAELPRARIQFAYGPVVRGGLSLTVRKFQPLLTFEKLLSFKSLDTNMARFLEACVRAKANILVSGGTGTGKTTIINLLSGFIPDSERVVTIEDAFELELRNRHWVALQTKEKASADDEISVSLADLLRSTLRMRPDRIIVGEIREHAGAEVMTQAANTGHEGTMTTIHANSGQRAINQRLATLLRQGQGATDEVARETVASAFQLVVQVSRARSKRYISEISVIDPTCVHNGTIVPEPIFRGALGADGEIHFIRDKKLRSDTDLYGKLTDAGLDVSEWENN